MAISQNIGQAIGSYAGYKISERRRQEAETTLMKILQRRATDPENYSEDQALADIAGIPRYADLAAKQWISNIQSQQEKDYQAARAKYWSEGGARGAAGSQNAYMKQYTFHNSEANRLQTAIDSSLEMTPEQIEELKRRRQAHWDQAGKIWNIMYPGQAQPKGPATMPSPGLAATAEQWLTPEGGMPAARQPAPTPAVVPQKKTSQIQYVPAGTFGGGYVPVPTQAETAQEPYITNDDEFEALPSGTVFIGPDGKRRRKP